MYAKLQPRRSWKLTPSRIRRTSRTRLPRSSADATRLNRHVGAAESPKLYTRAAGMFSSRKSPLHGKKKKKTRKFASSYLTAYSRLAASTEDTQAIERHGNCQFSRFSLVGFHERYWNILQPFTVPWNHLTRFQNVTLHVTLITVILGTYLNKQLSGGW